MRKVGGREVVQISEMKGCSHLLQSFLGCKHLKKCSVKIPQSLKLITMRQQTV